MRCLFVLCLASFFGLSLCSFYLGMFKKNDLLVAQDRLFKERVPYRLQYAKYGRLFKCPITYIRVTDRLGYGNEPKVTMIRGGLRRKYVVLRFSAYNKPISVNIYVGCENKNMHTTRSIPEVEESTDAADKNGTSTNESDSANASTPDAEKDTDKGAENEAAEGNTNAEEPGGEAEAEPAQEEPAQEEEVAGE